MTFSITSKHPLVKNITTLHGEPGLVPPRGDQLHAYMQPREIVHPTRGTWRKVWLPELKALSRSGLGATPLLVYLTMRHFARGSLTKLDFRRDTRGREGKAEPGEVIRSVPAMAIELGMSEHAFRAGMRDLQRLNLIRSLGRRRWLINPIESPDDERGVGIRHKGVVVRVSLSILAGLYHAGAGPRACIAYLIDRAFTMQPGLHQTVPGFVRDEQADHQLCLSVTGLAGIIRLSWHGTRELRRRMIRLGLYEQRDGKLFIMPVEGVPPTLVAEVEDARERQVPRTPGTIAVLKQVAKPPGRKRHRSRWYAERLKETRSVESESTGRKAAPPGKIPPGW